MFVSDFNYMCVYTLSLPMQSSGSLLSVLKLCVGGNEEVAHMAHQAAIKVCVLIAQITACTFVCVFLSV